MPCWVRRDCRAIACLDIPGRCTSRRVVIRLSADLRAVVDAWAAKQDDTPGRSEDVRRLIEFELTVSPTALRAERHSPRERARELAGDAIHKVTDSTASQDDQASRKRKLIKGPEEFHKVRRDRNLK
ncbi:hypothetical protein ACVIHI_004212 [Bradyrhizobium sp. USDA 4524]|uniref:hypothetical protein n=1 Tax=unclassified Bradyrhizobium TaxID=2631580 RepID=UPI00209F048A|nr:MULTISPECIES: hypothetical protein [unclassified Bradyrhizobium]MCP1842868.1 hypothetical protein [Bradyrhizobium sp. USDA 4538]MCP1903433.1 hypothetical protein [Bradyrhizobium sp. USDA 4537]MCP1990910.1 hypothetical protein [Bradyrhizobium sp. USDA 4539]